MDRDSLFTKWGTRFLGGEVAQSWADFYMWEEVLNRKKYRSIIELGSWAGYFSIYLKLQCIHREMKFRTIDTFPPTSLSSRVADIVYLRGDCYTADMWANGWNLLMRDIKDPAFHPLILLCDGGDKPREFKSFTPHLLQGDVVAVHDWDQEIFEKDIDYQLVRPLYRDESDVAGSFTRFFERI